MTSVKNILPENIDIEKVFDRTKKIKFQWVINKNKETFLIQSYKECLKLVGTKSNIEVLVDKFGNWIVLEDKNNIIIRKDLKKNKRTYNDIFKSMSI